MKNIIDLGNELGIPNKYLIPYGWDKAKIDLIYTDELKDRPNGKLVLVTAITPTKAGEGKTTTTIGLHDGLRSLGINSLAVLREPSLGPVFGLKGGAVGALKSTIIPEDDINLHFTGDMHALTCTINLIAAMIENTIYHGNSLNIDTNKIVWPRAIDMNDRTLRKIEVSTDGTLETKHESNFVITVASELMAVFCLAETETDFLDRAEKMIIAYTTDDLPVTVKDLHIRGAIKKLMHTALNPNLVQTLEENPVLIHGGPFANIAQGCNSVLATKLGLKLADVVITEAGFGADLGAEKFFDIKCASSGLSPDAVVLVATVRALKLHGGVPFKDLNNENIDALIAGSANLKQHFDNLIKFGVPVTVAINRFPSDTDAEISALIRICYNNAMPVALNTAALDGGIGARALAKSVLSLLERQSAFKPLYNSDDSLESKINKICREIYRADDVSYSQTAKEQLAKYAAAGYNKCMICMAKTPNSFSDDPKLLNTPTGHTIHVRELRLSAGAGFIVVLTGSIMTMPGLPKEPLATKME